ncbi:MAG: hypothetical protein ACYSO1_07980 [Planctomycetota bacterium]|jgi:hypothetical protein
MNTNEHKLFTMKNMKAMKEIAATCGRFIAPKQLECSTQASAPPSILDQSGWRRAISVSDSNNNMGIWGFVVKGGREQHKERSDV